MAARFANAKALKKYFFLAEWNDARVPPSL
jgi:hypothetical protein